jgi:hypothetical protein
MNHLLNFSFSSLKRYSQEFSLIVEALPQAIEHYYRIIDRADNVTKCKLRTALDAPKLLGLEVHILHREDERRLIFEAAFVMTLFLMPLSRKYLWNSVDTLLDRYPPFTKVEEVEQVTLLKYRNMMSIAILVLPPKSKKAHLLDLVTRIVEGNEVRYITGSGETAATRRRVAIYEKEGNIVPLPRPPRKNMADGSVNTPSTSRMMKRENFSLVTSSLKQARNDGEPLHKLVPEALQMSKLEMSNQKESMQRENSPESKRRRADSEANFTEAANVLLLLCSQAGVEGPATRSRTNSIVDYVNSPHERCIVKSEISHEGNGTEQVSIAGR